MNVKPLFFTRLLPESQLLICPVCLDGGSIEGRGKFLDHVKNQHPESATDAPDGPRWKQCLADAANKA